MTLHNQNDVIFEPVKLSTDHVFNLPPDTKELFIPVAPDIRLNAFLHEKPGNRKLMIYFQGNAKNLQNWLDNHSMVMDWGYNILVTDYRGFGKSEGVLDGQEQMYKDADTIYDYALASGYGPDEIVLYGYSMGTAMASYLASKRKARALILESPYSSIPEISWVGDKAPSYTLDNKEKAAFIEIPTLLIHGDRDDVITPDHSQRIYDTLKTNEKKMILITGGGHGDLRSRPEYKSLVVDFLDNI